MYFTEFKDTENFIKNTFNIKLGADYTSYNDVLKYSAQDEVFGTNNNPAISPALGNSISSASDNSSTPTYMTGSKCRDTTVGGNDAFNCYYQYNENDDIGHPFLRTDPHNEYSGMGRVYSETVDDNQQIMWMSFGVPYFNDVASFYANAIEPDLASLMNGGSNINAKSIGQFLGSTITTFLSLPAVPLVYLARALNNIGNVTITKYYEFQPSMDVYYRITNSILAHLAVNTGLANDGYFINGQLSGAGAGNNPVTVTTAQQNAAASQGTDKTGLPDVFSVYGYDMYRINSKRIAFQNANNAIKGTSEWTDTALAYNLSQNPVTGSSFTQAFISSFAGTIHDAALYIGFRIEKSTDSTEDLSNTYGESSVAQAINSKVESVRDTKFGFMNGNVVGGSLGGVVNFLAGAAEGAGGALAKATGTGGIADILMGDALIDIPDVWKNSAFHKSYNFTFELRSPYGDPISIMQSIYVPLSLILAGAFPRSAGVSSYTSPFILRAYCKGMFAIPLGAIETVHIKRGDAQYGWNHSMLPTCVDVSFTVRDLSPSMYVGLTDSNVSISNVFGTNSTFQEYLMTLSGMGLQERQRYFLNVRRRAQILLTIANETKLSPYYWGTTIGNSFVGRLISNFVPNNGLPNN